MDLAIVGLGHVFNKQTQAIEILNLFDNIEYCDKDISKLIKYNGITNYLKLKSSTILISTPPKSHLSIAKNVIKQNKSIMIEKPVCINLKELYDLKNIVNKDNYYNSLHFSFGLEIEYFIKYINKKPNKIYSYISDNYVEEGHIKKSKISMCGSYLDETINPISAITRMFGYDLNLISVLKKYYEGDLYDYYSKSKFILNDIPITIEVEWNGKESEKYIDLYYNDLVIRLDSMNQEVKINNKLIYKASGDRMTNHYIGVFKDYSTNKSNLEISLKLHEELLKGVDNED